jgi:hypothetical protein|tara:strand:+ start:442 stop:885 length:444 start_codon:yes stop_codon:yes gene_type:complete
MTLPFNTVDDFLRGIREAKSKQRPDIEGIIDEAFDDPHTIAVPPDLGDMIVDLTEKYGDEALRQIALFCIGKWFAYHNAYIEGLVEDDNIHAALSTTMDSTRVSQCMTNLETVSSFSGSEEWVAMVKDLAIGAVNDAFNEREDPDNK